MGKLACDTAEIQRASSVLFARGDVVELRILDAQTSGDRRPHIESGYFDDWATLAKAAAAIGKSKGSYVTLNPVNSALVARAQNRIRPVGKEPTTADPDILRRRWLPIDLDAVRPTGISSTDEEHAAALDFALTVRDHLTAVGWPEPILADSGNGAHLLYRVDLPADDGGLVERCLKALAAHFGARSEKVDLDTSVYNPARIWKLYGTVSCKGDSTPERPHRMARLLAVPSTIEVVPVQLLTALAGPAPAAKPTATQQPSSGRFDLDQWIAGHALPVDGPQPWRGGGRRWVFPVCPWNPEHRNRSAFIVQWPNGTIGAGCQHNGCSGKGWHDLRDAVEPGWQARGQSRARPANRKDAGRLVGTPNLVRLDTVAPTPIVWLWPGRIATGKLTMLSGDPGLGKSLLTIDLAARVSVGGRWPDSSGDAPLGGVVLLSAEDDAADTIRPRLDAAGADCSRINLLTGVSRFDPEANERFLATFNLARDLQAADEAIESTPDCRLFVIDPISAFCGSTDSHRNSDVRGLLAPLAGLAQRRQVAVVGVNHLTKSMAGVPAMYRTMGSLAFVAAARAAWAVVKDKKDPKNRLFLPIKNNLAADVAGLSYTIIEQGGAPCLAWSPNPVSVTADEALAVDRPDGRGRERKAAAAWLRNLLAESALTQKEIERQAEEAGLAWKTVTRAKKDVGVVSRREGFGPEGGWVWRLPAAKEANSSELAPFGEIPEKTPETPKEGQFPELAPFGASGPLSDDPGNLFLEPAAADGEAEAW